MPTALTVLAALLLALPASAQAEVVRDPPPSRPSAPSMVSMRPPMLDGPPDFRGELTDSDPVQDRKPYDAFSFDAQAGHEVTVGMTAQDFDTYLIVRSPSGLEWENDDFGDTRTSQVTFSAPTTGTYTIWATAFSESGRGEYEVFVSTAAATIVSTESGRLDYEDDQLIKGEYFDVLTIRPPSDGEFLVDLLPLGFAGFMRVTSPSGLRQSAQQGYDGSRSIRVGPLQGERGDWTVEITTVSAEEVGAYDLRVITMDEE